MANGDPGKGFFQNVWVALGVLLAIFLLMLILTKALTRQVIGQALEQTRILVGILAMITGTGASALALRMEGAGAERLANTLPGLVGVLAGATLLEIGDWASPAALGAAGVSMAIAFGLKKP